MQKCQFSLHYFAIKSPWVNQTCYVFFFFFPWKKLIFYHCKSLIQLP